MPTPDTTRAPPYHLNPVDSRHNRGIGMPAEQIEDHVEVEVRPFGGPQQLGVSRPGHCSPSPSQNRTWSG